MANKILYAKLVARNALASEFVSVNPILLKGEIGVEIDANKMKVGNGITNWNDLQYISGNNLDNMLKTEFAVNGSTGYVDKAKTADKLTTTRTIALIGDVTGNITFDGSENATMTTTVGAIAITDVYEAASQSAMLALNCQKGDIAIRSDVSKTFILAASPASTLVNWKELKAPTDTVQSVNGKTGVVILTTDDVAEGLKEYYTASKVQQEISDFFINNTIILDGGGA